MASAQPAFGTRRAFLQNAGLGAAAFFFPELLSAAPPARLPNILWLVSEDNGPFLGCYGEALARTPRLDALAAEGVRYSHAFANAPVCAPSRSTLATGIHAVSLGTQHMRSQNALPENVRFYSNYLRDAGYYCTNCSKEDYNAARKPGGAWDASSKDAHWRNRKPSQPFFAVFNCALTHESNLHKRDIPPETDPAAVRLPPYHPDTPPMRHDWARFHDQIGKMDTEFGARLDELAAAGLEEDTIVFYFADHGGVLPRSKRFLYDSGIHIPLIVRFPRAFQHWAGAAPGTVCDRIVSLVDFAPTVLSLAGIVPPAQMQGTAFLGAFALPEPGHSFAFRDRMDERYDLSRSIREKRYHYIRNFMPHQPWDNYVSYLHRMPAMQSWREAYESGTLNAVQRRLFEGKPAEELYDTTADPHEINNLSALPEFEPILLRMRKTLEAQMIAVSDTGLIPEWSMLQRAGDRAPQDALDLKPDELRTWLDAAWIANQRDAGRLPELLALLSNADSTLRYWGAVGCLALGAPEASRKPLLDVLEDTELDVRVTAAQALAGTEHARQAMKVLEAALRETHPIAALRATGIVGELGEAARPILEANAAYLAETWTPEDYPYRVLLKAYADLKITWPEAVLKPSTL
ncbi:MAG: sulfatase-like hydrolase/transferase [Candidatus Hydrogenedentes bacterium]|nr:sulfatase-like hydrolase/transferase [Candidatus Hydrogenedentota bacterium]